MLRRTNAARSPPPPGPSPAADFAPPQQAYEVFQKVSAEIQEQLDRLRRLLDTDLAAFNETVRRAAIPPVVPTPG